MTREEVDVEFAGLAHDHLMISSRQDVLQDSNTNGVTNGVCLAQNNHRQQQDDDNTSTSALSTIAILRRHPMYDSLVLVKRFRACLNGYTLEFPTSDPTNNEQQNNTSATETTKQQKDCCKTKLVTVYLDGDDPIYQCQERKGKNGLMSQDGEVVYVPINGLLDRLDNYDQHGISVDSRVYAFAMGLKTAERFLTSSSMKEIQETPPI